MTLQSTMRAAFMCGAASAILYSSPSLCGEAIRYEAAPAWVELADAAAASANAKTNSIILDQQMRIEKGSLWQYTDNAFRMASAQELTGAGTIGASWQPDKGDLIVHEVSILRGDAVIDVLAGGSQLEVLRREESLEQRMLDGMLTATLAVPGLQVGDVLRVRYSITRSEQMLGDHAEAGAWLFREPDVRPGFGRVRASWDAAAPIHFAAGPNVTLPAVTNEGGFETLELMLPLPEAQPVPNDAPPRFHRPPMLQLSTFADWSEISRITAPFYEIEGAISTQGELADRIKAIARDHDGELARSVAALEVVQEEIGYLANGLDGGNYLPQSPQQTWDLRYGDCKAKTKLLLAMLAGLGVSAEAVLVSTELGDGLTEMLPALAMFNHILVRARIADQYYWLDGTAAGANIALVGNVPPFINALPLSRTGAGLEAIQQILPRVPEMAITVDVDQRAGLDIPALVEARFDIVGQQAALFTANHAHFTEDQRTQIGAAMLGPMLGALQPTSVEFRNGADDSEIAVVVRSLLTSRTQFVGSAGEQQLSLALAQYSFAPDRARRQWRDIPVALGAPGAMTLTYRLHLPDEGEGYVLDGSAMFDDTIAGNHLQREASLVGDLVTVQERVSSSGGELAASAAAEERRRSAALARNGLMLRAPADVQRRWRFAGSSDRTMLEPVEQAYAAIIARDPDEAENLVLRANFRMGTYDFSGAEEDFTSALELSEQADLYARRSQARAELLNREGSRDDLQLAYDLDPGPWRAFALAEALADTGDLAGAMALVEEQDGDRDVRRQRDLALAELEARDGRAADGLALIDQLIEEMPGEATLLNAKCWFMGSWNIQLEEALPICTRAMENTEEPEAVLDSRAMAYFRMGQLDLALADANAALTLAPGQSPTLLLRGLIRRAAGDEEGESDISQAIARSPATVSVYRRYGFDVGSGG